HRLGHLAARRRHRAAGRRAAGGGPPRGGVVLRRLGERRVGAGGPVPRLRGRSPARARPGARVPDHLSRRVARLRIAGTRVPLRAHRGCAMEPPTNQGGHPMAATEDELAKQKVKEAFWQWTGRLIVLAVTRSEEHTSELQSRVDLVCRLLLEKKNRLNRQASKR